ncbi:MAG: hypothetical protein HYU37_02425 [Acidobacteria bacterium]|nr:hypothetical protein [Acidobacteriota bacterium]
MTTRTAAILVGVVAVGAALWMGLPGTVVDENGGGAATSAGLTSWGEPDLMGVWKGETLGASGGRDTFNLTTLEGLYKPEARARMQKMSAKDDPTLRCAPPAFPRAAILGHPLQIVQSPGFAFIFTEAYPVARIVPTTGRPHTAEDYRFPNHMGDSAGRWDGDTLVVDVMSFNGEGWLAGPLDKPTAASTGVWLTSPALHVVERWRRIDADTLEYRARVEDPDWLTMPWEPPAVTFTRQPVDVIDEALCRPEDGPERYLTRLAS